MITGDEDGRVTAESWATSPVTRKVMLGNRSRDTAPELAVRRLVHAAGLRRLPGPAGGCDPSVRRRGGAALRVWRDASSRAERHCP